MGTHLYLAANRNSTYKYGHAGRLQHLDLACLVYVFDISSDLVFPAATGGQTGDNSGPYREDHR